MNDFDNQPDTSAEFEADTLDNYSADEAAVSSLALELSDEESEARARVMRANLDQFDLDEEDLALLAGGAALAEAGDVAAGLPVLAVVGRPNVGKSSLLNAMAGYERAIVTNIPGTTRDTVETKVTLGGYLFRLVDTAGLRDSDDPIEQLNAFVQASDDQLLGRLSFAVGDHKGHKTIVLRVRPSKLPPPVLVPGIETGKELKKKAWWPF